MYLLRLFYCLMTLHIPYSTSLEINQIQYLKSSIIYQSSQETMIVGSHASSEIKSYWKFRRITFIEYALWYRFRSHAADFLTVSSLLWYNPPHKIISTTVWWVHGCISLLQMSYRSAYIHIWWQFVENLKTNHLFYLVVLLLIDSSVMSSCVEFG